VEPDRDAREQPLAGHGRDPSGFGSSTIQRSTPGGRFLGHERAYHGAPGCFVAVDNADHQQLERSGGVAQLGGLDRAALHGPAEREGLNGPDG